MKEKYGDQFDIREYDLYYHFLNKPDSPKFDPSKDLYIIYHALNWSFSDNNKDIRNLTCLGEIKVTKEDIEEYYIKNDMRKYNL